jgi:hypothetical protein
MNIKENMMYEVHLRTSYTIPSTFITIITFLDIIHRLVFCLKRRPVYISKHNVSETGFYLHPQVKPTQLGAIELFPTSYPVLLCYSSCCV